MIAKLLVRAGLVGLVLAGSAATVQAGDTTVEMLATEFSPENVTVQVGDTVTWLNVDSAVHDSVARDPAVTWNTGYVEPKQQATVSFDTAATYFYHCRIHPGMTGRVIVELAPPPTDTVEASAASADAGLGLGGVAALAAASGAVLAIVRRTSPRSGSPARRPGGR